MGCWSATVMGGDSALDYAGNIAKIFGLECDYEDEGCASFHGYHFTREMLEKRGVRKKLREAHERVRNDAVFGQVVGAIYLWAGARMTKGIRDGVIKCAMADGWAKEDEERRMYIDQLIGLVDMYWEGGERIELKEEGLFRKFAEMFG